MSIENDLALISDFDKNYCLQVFAPLPVAFVKGKGSYLYDTEGTKYLDMIGGIAVNSLGHGNPKLVGAITKQARDLIHCCNYYYIPQRSELAYRLCRASFADKAFFCNSGAEANEAAIKIARGYFHYKEQDKTEIITAEMSFHGRTYGSMTATGQEKFFKPFEPVVPGFKYVPFNDIEAMKAAVTSKTAAVMLELIQGESGVRPADVEYIKEVRKLCTEKNVLLIIDEVQTGIGRTGKMFCYQNYGITPDIMTLAKGLGGGVPIGAMLCTDEVATGFKVGDHGSTFGGNPLACAAGIAVMEYFGEANLLDNVNLVSAFLFEKLNKLKSRYNCIKSVRGMGLLIGIEFDETIIAGGLKEELFRNGFLVSSIGRSVIRIAPSLILTKSQANQFVKALDSLLSTRMGAKKNPILQAFKNIGRKEKPAPAALTESAPEEKKEAKPEEKQPALPAPKETEEESDLD
ncbi:MAG: aspartate aminotransferase family protein [Ruminococcaceae bacterium]|nr:aspartate aminotransferase family protein [Oscillospiraceae bacterium]